MRIIGQSTACILVALVGCIHCVGRPCGQRVLRPYLTLKLWKVIIFLPDSFKDDLDRHEPESMF